MFCRSLVATRSIRCTDAAANRELIEQVRGNREEITGGLDQLMYRCDKDRHRTLDDPLRIKEREKAIISCTRRALCGTMQHSIPTRRKRTLDGKHRNLVEVRACLL